MFQKRSKRSEWGGLSEWLKHVMRQEDSSALVQVGNGQIKYSLAGFPLCREAFLQLLQINGKRVPWLKQHTR